VHVGSQTLMLNRQSSYSALLFAYRSHTHGDRGARNRTINPVISGRLWVSGWPLVYGVWLFLKLLWINVSAKYNVLYGYLACNLLFPHCIFLVCFPFLLLPYVLFVLFCLSLVKLLCGLEKRYKSLNYCYYYHSAAFTLRVDHFSVTPLAGLYGMS